MALLSALVFQEKSEVAPRLPPRLEAATGQLRAIVARAAVVQAEAGLPIVADEYAAQARARMQRRRGGRLLRSSCF